MEGVFYIYRNQKSLLLPLCVVPEEEVCMLEPPPEDFSRGVLLVCVVINWSDCPVITRLPLTA